ncbi:NAD(P)-dependent oxidoreductase [Streptomyces albireticuli]|uniref:3-hydroxyisobutyrate dehydrogenase n=1 Tax=Streptomyces albireticuli TaxID=1940 RepID=A0A2A2D9S8_9ACTN|nr:NAD(P)-dependent oxidoreductase [Streptomyces albireticuli]MCD9141334.1 NAD(P)-dependent oxidoreductase [Streptomyces albireticuli]MCD9160705.1 NAD(P)-dependent oxidoreductase [Streptomyces albireticuli]MCD9191238.1 NAD(P)-dependent oxidoreductase [Streptomyces albireticuli]PAU48129.1 3-hydroxyisobutyrate dehydrogenase [Streptomyces albireticuli]
MSDNTPSVAVLGTGIMGFPMARNLARAGLDVRAWNRSREKAVPLAADGVRVAETPADAVRGAEVVLTMLHDGPAALEVMRDAASGLRAGAVWAQSTTAGLDGFDALAGFAREHGLVLVDAPVLGTRQPAEEGRLTVLAAGPEAVRGTLSPVFDAIGGRTVWVADEAAGGAATRLKLVVNSWVLTVTHGTAEALALAEGLGVDPAAFLGAVEGGPLDMGYLRAKARLILDGGLTPPSFATTTAEKDARLIVEAGERAGVRLDVTAAGAERFRRAAEQGHGQEDMAASYFASFDDRG